MKGDALGFALLLLVGCTTSPHDGVGNDLVEVQTGDVYIVLHQQAAQALIKRLEECR